jgi:hypothetical protein
MNSTKFSAFAGAIGKLEKEVEQKSFLKLCSPFPKSEQTEKAKLERIKRAMNDFWEFDKIYFSADMYDGGYSEPAQFHRDLINIAGSQGVQIVLAARKHAKTAMLKKFTCWKLLKGDVRFGGSLSSTLPNSSNILNDIVELLQSDRILFDFAPIFEESNNNQFAFRLPSEFGLRYFMAFSEGRSVRGATRLFGRPKFLLCDDLETRQSPLSASAVDNRARLISESYQSMGDDGTLIALGNNFDESCVMNRLYKEQLDEALPASWKVYKYSAWMNGAPLWPERFPAKSEPELRAMLKPLDEAEWQSDFQQNPVPPDGFIFKRLIDTPYWFDLPSDAKGVRWCDPNLSFKGKGDTTAMCNYLYSQKENKFYLDAIVCRSFSDSNKLLDAFYQGVDSHVIALGMDGNVSQESTWRNNVRNYTTIKGYPQKPINFKRYNVDLLAKNIQSIWNEGRILLPQNIADTPDGRAFLAQIYAFSGKKAGKKDDAPDTVISSHELITERHIYKQAKAYAPRSITDYFNF